MPHTDNFAKFSATAIKICALTFNASQKWSHRVKATWTHKIGFCHQAGRLSQWKYSVWFSVRLDCSPLVRETPHEDMILTDNKHMNKLNMNNLETKKFFKMKHLLLPLTKPHWAEDHIKRNTNFPLGCPVSVRDFLSLLNFVLLILCFSSLHGFVNISSKRIHITCCKCCTLWINWRDNEPWFSHCKFNIQRL